MRRVAGTISSLHRFLLVASSVAIGVFASRVASFPEEVGLWALLAAFSALMFLADIGRRVDENGRTLSAASRIPIATAREDALTKSDLVGIVASGGFCLLAFGVAFLQSI